ncbi:MAG: hypothetical protein JXA97_07705 [Anaerolineales bacterium]|nr:hypothetical protein [Anaerolineales bacterium]
MPDLDRDVLEIIERISTLQEPYRQNAVEWLEEFTQNGIEDVGADMPHFLGTLKPTIRRNFTRFVCLVLDEAAQHFSLYQ